MAGEVLTKPAIVDGKVYVGTSTYGGTDEPRMYKIDLRTGVIDAEFLVPTPHTAFYPMRGIGGSPAVQVIPQAGPHLGHERVERSGQHRSLPVRHCRSPPGKSTRPRRSPPPPQAL